MRWIDSFVICVLLPFVFFWFLISLAKDEFSVVRKHHPSPHFSALTCCLQLFRDFYFHHYHLLVSAVEFVSVHIHTYRQQRQIDNFERVYFHLPVVCLIVSIWNKIEEYKNIGIEKIWELNNNFVYIYIQLRQGTYAIRGFPFAIAHVVGPSFAPLFNNLARIVSLLCAIAKSMGLIPSLSAFSIMFSLCFDVNRCLMVYALTCFSLSLGSTGIYKCLCSSRWSKRTARTFSLPEIATWWKGVRLIESTAFRFAPAFRSKSTAFTLQPK